MAAYSMDASQFKFAKEPVQVLVGEPDKAVLFHVHPGVLSKSSRFFANRLKEEWTSTSTGPIKLEDHLPDVFNEYLDFLYNSSVDMGLKEHGEDVDVARAYVLAEFVMDEAYKAAIIREMETSMHWEKVYSPMAVTIIYNGTPEGSLARQFCIETWCKFARPGFTDMKGLTEQVPMEFVNDLLTAFVKDRESLLKLYQAGWKSPPI